VVLIDHAIYERQNNFGIAMSPDPLFRVGLAPEVVAHASEWVIRKVIVVTLLVFSQ